MQSQRHMCADCIELAKPPNPILLLDLVRSLQHKAADTPLPPQQSHSALGWQVPLQLSSLKARGIVNPRSSSGCRASSPSCTHSHWAGRQQSEASPWLSASRNFTATQHITWRQGPSWGQGCPSLAEPAWVMLSPLYAHPGLLTALGKRTGNLGS